jgi:antitoxin component HigA of HigAB toxin-antitoxin module
MLAVVRKPHTKKPIFRVRGEIPDNVLHFLKTNFTVDLEEDDEESVIATETDWYKDIKARTTPGDAMKIYRENFNYSQAKLGELLGGLSRHKISDMENDRRGISKEMAKKLSAIFKVPATRFI